MGQSSGPAVVVHSLAQARVALSVAAQAGVPVTLLSAPGAAGTGGPAWFRKLASLAGADYPLAVFSTVLDCGDRPGLVLAALRDGHGQVCFTGRKMVAEKLAAIAAQTGASLLTRRPKALDLEGEARPEVACRDWLTG
jgi:hypothetical protein